MNKLLDKLIIFIVCAALYVPNANNKYLIVPILIAVILSAAFSYVEAYGVILGLSAVFLVICFYEPVFIFFIPIMSYDIIYSKIKWIWILAFIPLIGMPHHSFQSSRGLVAAFLLVAYILKRRTVALENMKKEYNKLRDNTKEMSMQLEKKNRGLLEKQDYEINLATLKERNRIARDIHDNVGHLLSRSILQIGALLATNKNEETKESLRSIKDTLSEAMNSIRSSVHNLHEESIDLKTEIQKLIDSFDFCDVKLDYSVETNLEKNIKYCFIAVTKEALSNIINHSNATEASVMIREHPALLQLVIQDNGAESSYLSENGIGLKNIKDRVSAINGNVNISTEKGFRIFISVPKE
ncbi:MAG: histidine kinase [Bacillota bacterium]|nr:histidine kinase [Bacillota bacterium]